jgi:hypothetical protein
MRGEDMTQGSETTVAVVGGTGTLGALVVAELVGPGAPVP